MQDLDDIVSRALAAFRAAGDAASLENAKARFLGKGGELSAFRPSGTPEERKALGAKFNAAVRELGMSYSTFMAGLKRANIDIDRKVLADLAVTDKAAFEKIAGQVKANLAH